MCVNQVTIVCFSLLHYIQEHYQSCVAFTKSEPVVCPDCSATLLDGNDVSISFIQVMIIFCSMYSCELYVNCMGMHCTYFTAQGVCDAQQCVPTM